MIPPGAPGASWERVAYTLYESVRQPRKKFGLME